MAGVAVQPRISSGYRLSLGLPGAYWSNSRAFVAAAAGVAIGLGNVWRFPYLVDRYGGGAFLLVYLLCLLLVGLPILMAEVMVGRRGRSNPAECLGSVARDEGRTGHWQLVGWVGGFAGLLVLSGFGLVAGWSAASLGRTAAASGGDAVATGRLYLGLLAAPWPTIACQTLFLLGAALITGRGIRAGLERTLSLLLPALLLSLLGLFVYVALATGRLNDALLHLLRPDFSRLEWWGALEAMRHAFLTLGLGLGAMMSFGAALPDGVSITRASLLVLALDTAVALLTTVVVFSLLLAAGRPVTEGPVLAFMSVPAATDGLPGGIGVAAGFYGFLLLTSLSGAVGILHPVVEHLVGRYRIGRRPAALLAGGAAWLLGLLGILSVTRHGPRLIAGWSIDEWLGYAGSNLLLPAAALGLVFFCGRAMSRRATRLELRLTHPAVFVAWRWLIRYPVPLALVVLLLMAVLERVWS
jgi:NSS family neurotransmitter:Na+ symporter